ncbi:MAG TPA: UDP-N-acetylglucosamine 1-carboxyvinyltransferase [Thermoanaerobaculia bacterium]|jgi:UDP-N-acetylglucosamine 1-carboxyvinyltransferase|nr:UDP-N-acetylglucosamine 1-carboxyvinyltransferase [Thermoanaerobaculia bacterium]
MDNFGGEPIRSRYRIVGGKPLRGEVTVGAAKNAIGKQLVASLLTNQQCIFSNVPRITEIDAILDMLSEVGLAYQWLAEDRLRVQTEEIRSTQISQRYSGFNRIPILLLGPLIHRAGEATVPLVGGCDIGERPVDYHINALRAMGAEIELTGTEYIARASGLHGTTLRLNYPSVGATENIIMAASLAKGKTVIENAAVEPEVIDTILFLQKMGAQIQVEVDRRVIIEGVNELTGVEHVPLTDRIEVASFAIAAVATNGSVKVWNAQQEYMISFLNNLRKVGGGFEVGAGSIRFFRAGKKLRPVHVETDVHPGFMTDWQQPFVVLLTQADGVSVVHETVYEDRFGYVQDLSRMGAEIDLSPACLGSKQCRYRDSNYFHSAIVRGATNLSGQSLVIPDLRAGFAYLVAALVAKGESEIRGIKYIERGYANVPNKLKSIGAEIHVEG